MRNLTCGVFCVLLCGCGLESAGSAATIGKLQAEQAKQAQKDLQAVQIKLDAAMTEAAKNREKAEEASEK